MQDSVCSPEPCAWIEWAGRRQRACRCAYEGMTREPVPYLVPQRELVALALGARAVHQHARVRREPRERQAHMRVQVMDLTHRARVLQLGCGLLLYPCRHTQTHPDRPRRVKFRSGVVKRMYLRRGVRRAVYDCLGEAKLERSLSRGRTTHDFTVWV